MKSASCVVGFAARRGRAVRSSEIASSSSVPVMSSSTIMSVPVMLSSAVMSVAGARGPSQMMYDCGLH